MNWGTKARFDLLRDFDPKLLDVHATLSLQKKNESPYETNKEIRPVPRMCGTTSAFVLVWWETNADLGAPFPRGE
jgi:hypothetical protein